MFRVLESPGGRGVAGLATGCWNASSAPLDGAWASLALGEQEAMSLCELHFTSLG